MAATPKGPAELWTESSSPGDVDWGVEEPKALRQGRQEAELTLSADSVRAYLKQIGKVALLNAEQEVGRAKRIEVGLYAAERLRRVEDATDNGVSIASLVLPPVRGGRLGRPGDHTHCLRCSTPRPGLAAVTARLAYQRRDRRRPEGCTLVRPLIGVGTGGATLAAIRSAPPHRSGSAPSTTAAAG
jgi:hypothetical protein